MTKTTGTATFTGNVNGGALTLSGAGGTLDLGAGLTHVFTGAITMTAPTAAVNSTLAVGTSTLTAGSIGIAGGSTSGYNSILSVSTGTINCTGAITFSGTAARHN